MENPDGESGETQIRRLSEEMTARVMRLRQAELAPLRQKIESHAKVAAAAADAMQDLLQRIAELESDLLDARTSYRDLATAVLEFDKAYNEPLKTASLLEHPETLGNVVLLRREMVSKAHTAIAKLAP